MAEDKKKKRVSIIGEGSWATAITHMISQNNISINWWVRKEETLNFIKNHQRNPSYLSSVQIDPSVVTPYLDINECIKDTDIVYFVVPAAFVKDVFDQIDPEILKGKILVSAIKGMMPKYNCIVTEYLYKNFPVKTEHLCIVGGPCHAEEVALNRQSYLTIGCEDLEIGYSVAETLQNLFVNVQCEKDLTGIEYAAVMKNIIALAKNCKCLEAINIFLSDFSNCSRNFSLSKIPCR